MEILKKKNKIIRYHHLLLSALLLAGMIACKKKDATVKLPEVAPKLVVISFISPQDTLIRVTVTLTQPLYNNAEANKYKPVENAKVIIAGNGHVLQLTYNDDEKAYVGDPDVLQVTEGATYDINVSTPDGKLATASTSIPASNTTLTYNYSSAIINQFNEAEAKVTTRWTDPLSTTDYYRLVLQRSSYYLFTGFNQQGNFEDTITTRIAYSEWALDSDYNNRTELEKTLVFRYYENYDENIYLYLLHVSKEYYDYSQKLQSSYVSGNPFQEPSIMYTNMTGGLGVFAGYNSYRVAVQP